MLWPLQFPALCCPHSLCWLHQWHSAQAQHHLPPCVPDLLDGGDLEQVKPFNQVKTYGTRAEVRAGPGMGAEG